MKKIFAAFFFFISLSPSSWGATPLSLDDYLEQAKKFDFNFQDILLDKVRAKYEVDLGATPAEVLITLETEYGFNSTSDKVTNDLAATLSKELPTTGTNISLQFNQRDQLDREEEIKRLRIGQSLVRNFLGKQERKKRESLSLEVDVIELQVAQAYQDYLYELSVKYFDFYQAYQELLTAQGSLKEALQLEKSLESRLKANIANSIDRRRMSLQLENEKEQLLMAEQKYRLHQKEIATLLKREGELLMPATQWDFSAVDTQLEELKDERVDELMKNSRDFRIFESQLQQTKLNRQLEERDGLPEASLFAGYNIDNSERFNTKVNREEFAVGVRLDIPLGDGQQKAQVQQSALEIQKAQSSLRLWQRNWQISFGQLKSEIAHKKKLLEINEKKKRLAQEQNKEFLEKYKIGRATLEDLIEGRNNLLDITLEEKGHQIDLFRLYTQWLKEADLLLVKDSLEMPLMQRD